VLMPLEKATKFATRAVNKIGKIVGFGPAVPASKGQERTVEHAGQDGAGRPPGNGGM